MECSTYNIKKSILGIFDKFISVCEKYNLQYTLIGGSLLGAVRHQGIIPWDDDIDVGMPRQDYEKLLSIGEQAFRNDYILVSIYNDKNYIYPFAKLYDNRTTLIESKEYFYPGGTYIDIFPLDGIPADKGTKRIKRIWDIRYAAINLILSKNSHQYRKKHFFKYIIYKILFKNFHNALKQCDRYSREYPCKEEYHIANYFGAWKEKEISDYSWFFPFKRYTFEGRNVWGPNNHDAYLKKLYGDYMTPPTVEKRRSHHSHYFIDLTRRYTIEELHEMGY